MKGKARLTDEQFKSLLIKELAKKGSKATLKTNFYEHLRTKFSVHKQRAFKLWDQYYPEIMGKRNQKSEDTFIGDEVESIRSIVKSKDENAKTLLNTVDILMAEVEALRNVKKGVEIVDGERIFTYQNDVTQARNVVKGYIGEIRAILNQIGMWYGFNAPTKQDLTTKGESITPVDNDKLNKLLSKLR